MILQTDSRLRKAIHDDGCYYMSIFYLVNKWTGLEVSADFIDSLFDVFVSDGEMSKECYILDPEKIFNHLGFKVKYRDVHDKPTRMCKPDEVEILYFFGPAGGHFVAGDGKGNVAYDPWGVSRAVSEGRLVSKRIFRRL